MLPDSPDGSTSDLSDIPGSSSDSHLAHLDQHAHRTGRPATVLVHPPTHAAAARPVRRRDLRRAEQEGRGALPRPAGPHPLSLSAGIPVIADRAVDELPRTGDFPLTETPFVRDGDLWSDAELTSLLPPVAEPPREVEPVPAVECEPAEKTEPASRRDSRDAGRKTRRARKDGRKDGKGPAPSRRGRLLRRPLLVAYLVVGVAAAAVAPGVLSDSKTVEPSTELVSYGSFKLEPGMLRTIDVGERFTDGSATGTFVVPKRPTGGGVYFGFVLRSTNRNGYYAKVRVLADGSLRFGFNRTVDGKELRIATTDTPGRVRGGETVHVHAKISGTSKVTLAGRAWIDGEKRPPLFTATDTAGRIKGEGAVKTYAYLSNTAAAMTLTFDAVTSEGAGEEPVTTPTAGPTVPTPSATATMKPPTSTTITSKPSTSTGATPPATGGGGGGKPGPNNTGVPSGTKLKVHQGDLNITKAGTVINGLDVRGFVTVRASNVTIKNTFVRGGKATSGKALIGNTDPNVKNLVIQDSTLKPDHPSVYLNGLAGGNFTARRLDISGSVDGAQLHKNNVRIEDTWIHDLSWFAHDPNHGGGESHNDGVQVLNGTDIVITGNSISGADNAGMQVTQDVGPVKGLKVTGNWIDGGDCSIKLQHRDESKLGPVVVQNNRFGRNTAIANCPILRTGSTILDSSGNTFTDGASVAVRVDG